MTIKLEKSAHWTTKLTMTIELNNLRFGHLERIHAQNALTRREQ